MGRDEFEQLKGGVLKRRSKRRLGLFIDGVGLDRATRRLARKVDLAQLVSGLSFGLKPELARYYTLIPYEDDARQFAFLDAVEKAGLEVVTKRLPPKGVKRQVSMDVHMATDLVAFALGLFAHDDESNGKDPSAGAGLNSDHNGTHSLHAGDHRQSVFQMRKTPRQESDIQRVLTVVCPTRELSYAIYTCHNLGVEMSLADFGLYGVSDGWKGVDRWVDLSTSETIWRD